MELEKEVVEFIYNYVKKAKDLGTDLIGFEQGLAKSRDDTSSVILLQDQDVPEFPFEYLGINRINAFLSRYDLVGGDAVFEATIKEIKNRNVVTSISMKGKKISAEYRCVDPEDLRIPRQINDEPTVGIKIDEEEIDAFIRGISAMGSDMITVLGDKTGVNIEMLDATNDIMKIKFSSKVKSLNGEEPIFTARFSAKMFATMLKKITNGYFEVGEKGVAYFYMSVVKSNDLMVCLLPRI